MERPYIVIKKLRVRDLRDDDIVSVWDAGSEGPKWMLWRDAPHWYDELDIINVQVIESPADPNPNRTVVYGDGDDAVRDALRGQAPE